MRLLHHSHQLADLREHRLIRFAVAPNLPDNPEKTEAPKTEGKKENNETDQTEVENKFTDATDQQINPELQKMNQKAEELRQAITASGEEAGADEMREELASLERKIQEMTPPPEGKSETGQTEETGSSEKQTKPKENAGKPEGKRKLTFEEEKRVKEIDARIKDIERQLDFARAYSGRNMGKKIDNLLQEKKMMLQERSKVTGEPMPQQESATGMEDTEQGRTDPSENAEKGNKTNGERLEQDMRDGLKELKEAKDGTAQFAAFMKLIATILEFLKMAMNGKLNEVPSKEKDKGSDKEKPTTPADEDPSKRVRGKINENPDKPSDATDLPKNLDRVAKENREKISKNEEQIKSIDDKITTTKKEQEGLIDRQAELKKQINSLQGNEEKDEERKALETQLDSLEKQIEAKKQEIIALDKQRDELEKENKTLQEEIDAIDKMRPGIDGALKKVMEVLNQMLAILKEQGHGMELPNITFGIDKDGNLTITFVGGSREVRNKIKPGMGDNDEPVTVRADELPTEPAAKEKKEIPPAKDASPGEIRQDKNGNYWKKGEDRYWTSYNDPEKGMSSGSEYQLTRWPDSTMDENTAKIIDERKPEENTPASSNEEAPSSEQPAETPAAASSDADTPAEEQSAEQADKETNTPPAENTEQPEEPANTNSGGSDNSPNGKANSPAEEGATTSANKDGKAEDKPEGQQKKEDEGAAKEQNETDQTARLQRLFEIKITDMIGSSPRVRTAVSVEKEGNTYTLALDASRLNVYASELLSTTGYSATNAIEAIKKNFVYNDKNANRYFTKPMTADEAESFMNSIA